jgi:hypothetical protein
MLVLLGLSCTPLSAQIRWRLPQITLGKPKPPVNRSFVLGVGAGNLAFKDELSSPRIYEGNVGTAFMAYEKLKTKRLFVSELAFQGGFTTDGAPSWQENSASALAFRWHMGWLWALRPADKALQWYAGPALLQYVAVRINTGHGNGAVGYEQSYNLGGRSRLEYRLPLSTNRDYAWWIFNLRKIEKRILRVGWELDLPLAGWQFRPPYNGLLEGVGNDAIAVGARDMLNNSRLAFLGNFFYLNSQVYVRYPLRNGNRLQLAYQWMGYSRSYLDMPVRQASGVLVGSLVFRLDQQEDIR